MSIVVLAFLIYSSGLVRFIPVGLALLLWAGAIVVTLVYNAPVNELAVQWDPEAPPANWEQFRDQWHRGGGLVTVAGAYGMGKTRLAAELARDCHHAGAAVIYASGTGRPPNETK